MIPSEPETVPYVPPSMYHSDEDDESDGVEVSWDMVFEMELKKRQVLNQAKIH